jgi:hypothetical protein
MHPTIANGLIGPSCIGSLSYMGNVRDRGFLRYFELTPSRYHAQLECLNLVDARHSGSHLTEFNTVAGLPNQ